MPTTADLPGSPPSGAQRASLALVLALAGLALLLPGCDNPACVFGGDCSGSDGGGGAFLGQAATVPEDGQWIAPGLPQVTQVFPSGPGASSTSPIVIVFSESIAGATLEGAFDLVQELDVPGGPTTAPPLPLGGALLGDGRVAVLFPPLLTPGASYQVRTSAQGTITDLTGQRLAPPLSGLLGTFSVAATNPVAPRLVTSWPRTGTTGSSTIPSLVTVFDRPMNPLTVTSSSFEVVVDGLPPAFDPPPQVLRVPNPFGDEFTEPRVFTWRSVDPAGTPQSLGAGLPVELFLSPPGGGVIESAAGEDLAPVVISFDTAAIELPLGAELLSGAPEVPDDAIGLAQLDGSAPLMVLVRLGQPAEEGDVLRITLFGTDFGTPPRTTALARSVELAEGEDEVLLEEAELDLVATQAPLAAHFADGPLAFAFQHVRGSLATPVRMLDTDPSQAGVQHPVLDLQPPKLLGLGFEGGTLDLRSNLPDLVLTGRADEQVRAVRVEAMLLSGDQDNGNVPPVAAADASGRFIAVPIPLGLIDPAEGTIPVLVTVFDRALNASEPVAGTYTQVGAVGPGLALPGGDLDLRVFSAASLAPIAGARVFVHEDDGGVLTPVATALTGAGGAATVASAPVGVTILTVEAAGHDLFTFQGVMTSRLDVPLGPTAAATGTVALAVSSPLEDLPQLSLLASDSRRPPELGPTVATQGCFFNPFTLTTECAFLPFAVGARVPGALSVFAVNPSAGNGPAFAQLFLKAFQMALPLAPVPGGETQAVLLQVPVLLDSIGADPELAAVDLAPHALLGGASVPGLDSASLVGSPRISVQALATGIPGPIFVGLGRAFEVTADTWTVRAAHAGAASGELVQSGAIDGDLFLEAVLVDTAGNRAGARPRLSGTGFVLDPPGVPTVEGGTVEGGAGSLAFTVTVTDGLVDADGQPGLHRVRLVDSAGRGWDLWTVDAPDAAGGSLVALFPDVAALGGTGLGSSGSIAARAATFAWPALDPGGFLWVDASRERQLFSASAPLTLAP